MRLLSKMKKNKNFKTTPTLLSLSQDGTSDGRNEERAVLSFKKI